MGKATVLIDDAKKIETWSVDGRDLKVGDRIKYKKPGESKWKEGTYEIDGNTNHHVHPGGHSLETTWEIEFLDEQKK